MDLTRIARGGTPLTLDRPRILFFDKAATWALVQRYGIQFVSELYAVKEAANSTPEKPAYDLELKDIDALEFFLWIGLQADAKQRGEDLTLERVSDFVVPLKIATIFNKVVLALARVIETPARAGDPGNVPAAAASPAAAAKTGPGPTKASTTLRRSGSPSPSSGRPRKSSGRRR